MALDPALRAKITQANKKYGAGTVLIGSEIVAPLRPTITTGSLNFDACMGGGWAAAKWNSLIGHECLVGETRLKYQVRSDGRLINHKGGSIETLWKRFHGEPGDSRWVQDAEFFVASVNDEDRIITNRIRNVIKCGEKECFQLVTSGGLSITTTGDHRFYTGTAYVPLKELQPGQEILIHNGTRFRKDEGPAVNRRPTVLVKHHPSAPKKTVRDPERGYENVYHRLQRSHAVLEAEMNGLTYSDYIALLNSEADLNIITVPPGMHVHHLDEDFLNDVPGNLAIISPTDHGLLHATEGHNNLRYMAVGDVIESITPVGIRQTFDLEMEAPYKNYVANDFIVHNSSGKTYLTLKTIAANQALNPDFTTMWFATEDFNEQYAKMLGVDLSQVIVINTNEMEVVFEEAIEGLKTKAVDLMVIDSLPYLVSTREDEGGMDASQPGQSAFLTGKFFRKSMPSIKRNLSVEDERLCTGIVINGWREKIGVKYGDPRVAPGGKSKDFVFCQTVDIARDQFITDTRNRPVGQTLRIRNIKNKLARPGLVGYVDAYVADFRGHKAGEFDLVKDSVSAGIAYGVIEHPDKLHYSFAGVTFNGKPKLEEGVAGDRHLQRQLRKAVLSAAITPLVEDEVEDEEPPPALRKRTAKKTAAKKKPARAAR